MELQQNSVQNNAATGGYAKYFRQNAARMTTARNYSCKSAAVRCCIRKMLLRRPLVWGSCKMCSIKLNNKKLEYKAAARCCHEKLLTWGCSKVLRLRRSHQHKIESFSIKARCCNLGTTAAGRRQHKINNKYSSKWSFAAATRSTCPRHLQLLQGSSEPQVTAAATALDLQTP